ncbi:hypothetical protein OOT00_11375 [Desulfobotulus sp. H1]|uniref:Uncharacterized protein n=1 Tax=Desulfobotulus pelophilus TaxID=2823377 RepID=A0ABT3NAU6_9BACT|nr:hypothetical protein [Desulfobotulus pelophilus]MCW7754584.1 hypothetical protein [Desulfobotulus pelophilus]
MLVPGYTHSPIPVTKKKERLLFLLRNYFVTPQSPGEDLLDFAAQSLGFQGEREVAEAMVDPEDGNAAMLRDLCFFPGEDLRRRLLPVWAGRPWSESAIYDVAGSLLQAGLSFTMSSEEGWEFRFPFTAKEIRRLVDRLFLQRKVDVYLWEQLGSRLPKGVAENCWLRLWTCGVDTVGERARVLDRLVSGEGGSAYFNDYFHLVTEVMAEVSEEVLWPEPLLRRRRNLERTVLAARRVAAALERGTMETLLLSGSRVVDADPDQALQSLCLAEWLLYRLWPGSLPAGTEVESRDFSCFHEE